MLTRFVIYGLGGFAAEVVATALMISVPSRDWRLVGHSYLWMFPIYGSLAVVYEPLHDAIRGFPLVGRAVFWSLAFTAAEYATGWVLARVTGRCPWDYVADGWRFAINPYIRWDYFPLWAAVGLALEPVHDFLVRVTPAIEAAL